MNIFARAMQIADRSQVRIMGEPVQLLPRVGGQYAARKADTARSPVELSAVFTGEGEQSPPGGSRLRPAHFKGTSRATMMAANLWLSAEQVAALPWRPRAGDQVVLSARQPVETYAVSALEPNDLGDLVLVLVLEDAP